MSILDIRSVPRDMRVGISPPTVSPLNFFNKPDVASSRRRNWRRDIPLNPEIPSWRMWRPEDNAGRLRWIVPPAFLYRYYNDILRQRKYFALKGSIARPCAKYASGGWGFLYCTFLFLNPIYYCVSLGISRRSRAVRILYFPPWP